LVDPGNAGTQIANINQDMVDSVKFLSASYGAEYAKGPAILQAFSKSGGQKYHGEGYLYTPGIRAPLDMPTIGTPRTRKFGTGRSERP
jgi:hypothetical protein